MPWPPGLGFDQFARVAHRTEVEGMGQGIGKGRWWRGLCSTSSPGTIGPPSARVHQLDALQTPSFWIFHDVGVID